MFAKLPDPMPGVKCDEKRGWLPPGFSEHCREIINKQVLVMLRKKMNIPINCMYYFYLFTYCNLYYYY